MERKNGCSLFRRNREHYGVEWSSLTALTYQPPAAILPDNALDEIAPGHGVGRSHLLHDGVHARNADPGVVSRRRPRRGNLHVDPVAHQPPEIGVARGKILRTVIGRHLAYRCLPSAGCHPPPCAPPLVEQRHGVAGGRKHIGASKAGYACSDNGKLHRVSALAVDQRQHFLAAVRIVQKAAQHPARDHADPVGLHASTRHATMLRLDHHRHALRL